MITATRTLYLMHPHLYISGSTPVYMSGTLRSHYRTGLQGTVYGFEPDKVSERGQSAILIWVLDLVGSF